jgi:adenylate kinase
MNDLILVGIQGSGKGTQARILAEKFGYQIFETGGELRVMAKEESELGKKVKEITERGDLVPNEIVMEIVENFLNKTSLSIITSFLLIL